MGAQLNPEYLEDMSAGDGEFIREILATFLESSTELLEAIQLAAREASAESAIYTAHTLKGSARSIGAGPLGDVCEELEKLARAGDMDGFALAAAHLPQAFAKLEVEVQELFRVKAA